MVEITNIKLDKIDRKILTELDKNCRIPTTTLAKKVRRSRQAVEYRINQLVKKGIILGFHAAINPHKMGYKIYKIYLKLRNIPQEKKSLLHALRSSGLVYWMGEFSGNWDLIFAVFAKDDYEFFEMKNNLISKYNSIIVEEEGGILLDVKQYYKMYFLNEIIPSTIMFGGKVIQNKLDTIDGAILNEIVNNARIPINELAKKININPGIVRRKLKELGKKGIIIQYKININMNKLGLELYKVILKIDRYTKKDEQRLVEYLSRLPNIHYIIRNLWQIEPELVVSNYHEYYKLVEDLKKEFPEVIRTVDSLLMITDEWTPGFQNLLTLKPKTI